MSRRFERYFCNVFEVNWKPFANIDCQGLIPKPGSRLQYQHQFPQKISRALDSAGMHSLCIQYAYHDRVSLNYFSRFSQLFTALSTSACYFCVKLEFHMRSIIERRAIPYITVAKGLHWVVPSWDCKRLPATNRSGNLPSFEQHSKPSFSFI